MTIQSQTSTPMQAALAEAIQDYIEANPKSHVQHSKAAEVLPGGNTRTVLYSNPFPITLTSAKGCYVTSLDGKTYIDYLGEFTAGLYGHSHPVLRESIEVALNSGWVRGGHIEQEEELARLICNRFPSIELIRFANSGTEANLYAISVARAISGKKKIMVFEGGYHGGVFVFSGSAPSPITAPFDFVLAPYNDWDATLALLEQNREDLACILIEPMQGSGGCIPASVDFLRALQAWAEKNDTLFILDEVMTSRMSGGGLQEVYGLKPDMTTLGKYIGGGFSFGAFGGRKDIMDCFNPSQPNYISHAGTFNNNIFTMSAGVAGYGKVFTPQAAQDLSRRGEKLRSRLNRLAEKVSFPMQFTGVGSLMNVHMYSGEIKSIKDSNRGDMDLRNLFYFDMLREGIWAARRGMLNLSLPMDDAEFEQLVNAVACFIDKRKGIVT